MFRITEKRELNASMTLMKIAAPHIAEKALPGQFIIFRIDEQGERVPLTIADCDKQKALPLIRRFYDIGFNVEATKGTADFLRANGIRTRTRKKLSEGSNEIFTSLRQGHVNYVINTIDINQSDTTKDGFEIRRCAVENNVSMFTSLETVRVLLDVLEEITLGVSTIDSEQDKVR